MKPEWRRFAPIGLYVALAAVLVSAGLYIVMREWNLWLQISLGLIVVGLAVFVLLDPDRVRLALTGRQARYGSNALVLAIAFLGILVVINYLVIENTQQWDLTEDKKYVLADETVEVLEKLDEEVTAQAFFSQVSPEQAETLLHQYKLRSGDKLEYTFIDAVGNPIVAEQAGVKRDGTVVLTMGEKKEIVTTVTEKDLTSALVRLISNEVKTVYFLTGHGEYALDGGGEQSYSQAKTNLAARNYKVESLNLLATNQIPEDAQVIVIAGPKKPVSAGEVEMLAGFVQGGGGLVIMEEPLLLTEFGGADDPLAGYLAQTWGITLGNDFIIDQSSNQPSFAIASEWGAHTTVQSLKGFVGILPTARSVSTGGAGDGATTVTLVTTTANAWAETDMEALQSADAQIQPDAGVDLLGPVPLAAAAENQDGSGRIVVFGDADFITNAFLAAYGNEELFFNSVDWIAGEEELIGLTPKETISRALIPPQKYAMNLIMLLVIFVLPGLALLGAVLAFVQKRRRG